MAVKVIASHFSDQGMEGDFGWMIERPDYADALFIFNDNEAQFRAFVKDPTPGTFGCQDGGGNAGIRHHRCVAPPRAAGIPTGPGYLELTEEVRRVIDEAFDVVEDLLASGRYQRLFYSAGKSDDDLGTNIFEVGDDVKRYIVTGLRKFGDPYQFPNHES